MGVGSAVLYASVLGLASHYIGEALPRRWFHPERFPFRSFAWERGGIIYRKIAVHKWKDFVPDLSKVFPRMLPKRVMGRETSVQTMELVRETCVAEAVHGALMLLSPLVWAFCPNVLGLILMLVYSFVFNLPYLIIQRYNRPKLLHLAQRLQKKEEETGHALSHTHV